MREIKFRAYCKVQKKMFYPEVVQCFEIYKDGSWNLRSVLTEECLTRDTSDGEMKEYYDGILMQYTGLKDETGVEWYEGDIAGLNPDKYGDEDDSKAVIVFNNGAFRMQFYREGRPCDWFCDIKRIELEQFVVKGNLYENPELLK